MFGSSSPTTTVATDGHSMESEFRCCPLPSRLTDPDATGPLPAASSLECSLRSAGDDESRCGAQQSARLKRVGKCGAGMFGTTRDRQERCEDNDDSSAPTRLHVPVREQPSCPPRGPRALAGSAFQANRGELCLAHRDRNEPRTANRELRIANCELVSTKCFDRVHGCGAPGRHVAGGKRGQAKHERHASPAWARPRNSRRTAARA